MKTKRLLAALGQLDEQYIEEAADRPHERKRRNWIRRGAAAAAIMLILVGTVGTAMALSPEFFQRVLAFFHMEQAETVPDHNGEGSAITQSGIGGLVKAEYVRLESFHYASGYGTLYQVDREENGTIRTVQFWAVEDGALLALDTQKHSFTTMWQGKTYQGDIYWCAYDGEISLYSNGIASFYDSEWYAAPIPGRMDAVWLYLFQGSQSDYWAYPVLYHLDTGEAEDVLRGTGAEELSLAYDYQWSGDLSKVIVTCRSAAAPEKACVYFCDVLAKELSELQDLTGVQNADALFADDSTLLLTQFTEQGCSVFTYDLHAGQIVQILDQIKCFGQSGEENYGMMFFGGQYGLYVNQAGGLSVFDLKTGEETFVDGFAFCADGRFIFNRSNTKLLYYVADDSANGLGVSQLGVLDLSAGTFTAFDRAGYDSLYEWSVGWFDDERVEVWSRQSDTGAIYLYEF